MSGRSSGMGYAGMLIAALMALLFGFVLLFIMAAAPSGGPSAVAGTNVKPGTVPPQFVSWVERAGRTCEHVSAPLLAAQLNAENASWDPNAVSSAGAKGYAQFMDSTWEEQGRDDDGNGRISRSDAGDSIMAMARYDCFLAEKFKDLPGDLTANMLAGYQAGHVPVLKYKGIPPFPETQAYVHQILDNVDSYTAEDSGSVNVSDEGTSGQSDTETSQFGRRVVAYARKWLGTPYVWGGGNHNGPSRYLCAHGVCGRNSFDCSGLVQYAVYQASGKKLRLPRVAIDQSADRRGKLIPRDWSKMRPGDIIAFSNKGWGHIGIYIGNRKMIHAPRSGLNVMIAPLSGYYASQQWRIRRFG